METRSELKLNDVVLVTDLANTSTRRIHPALGRITGFLDPETKSQAIVQYSTQTNPKSTVNRPISKLVRIVKADETIPAKGKCFCPLALPDELLQEPPEPDHIAAADLQDEDQRHLRVPAPLPEAPLPQVEEEVPVDRREEAAPPQVEVVEVTSQRPGTVLRGGPSQASLNGETAPARGRDNTQADRPQRPERTRKKLSKFDN